MKKKFNYINLIGRVFKYNLSNEFLAPTTKQSQGLVLAKLLN